MQVATTASGRVRSIAALAVEAYREWVRDRCGGLAAAMAFNGILAAAPFVTVLAVLAGIIFGEQWTRAHLFPVVLAWIGPRGLDALRFLLMDREQIDPATLLSLSLVASAGLVVGTSGFFLQMQDALETIWDVRREEARVWVQFRKRLRGLLYAMASAILTLAGLAAAGLVFSLGRTQPPGSLLGGVRLIAEACIAFLTFWTLITFWLKFLPPVRLALRQILPWAALIAAFHLLGRLILTWRAAAQDASDGGSAAESLILVILWFYYASMIFLYGAELMRLSLDGHRSAPLLRPAGT